MAPTFGYKKIIWPLNLTGLSQRGNFISIRHLLAVYSHSRCGVTISEFHELEMYHIIRAETECPVFNFVTRNYQTYNHEFL